MGSEETIFLRSSFHREEIHRGSQTGPNFQSCLRPGLRINLFVLWPHFFLVLAGCVVLGAFERFARFCLLLLLLRRACVFYFPSFFFFPTSTHFFSISLSLLLFPLFPQWRDRSLNDIYQTIICSPWRADGENFFFLFECRADPTTVRAETFFYNFLREKGPVTITF